METKDVFNTFLNELKIDIPEYDIDEEVKHIETYFYPEVLKILQRDETFFDSPRLFCKVDLSEIWKQEGSYHELIWKQLQMAMFSSFLHGDIKEKITTLMGTVKSLWSQSGQENDEISKILNDENTEDHFKEIIDYLQETRLAKLFTNLVETIELDEFVNEINFEDPNQIFEMFKNPDHPIMKKMVGKVKDEIERKIQHGELTQNQILAEIEGIKNKVQSIFGNVINEMLGIPTNKNRGTRPILNTPQARAQNARDRLRQRLERKYKEEEFKKNNSH